MKFFFSFWCNKVCLAEGGSACGCGRACVKEEWDVNDHTSPRPESKCSVNCLEAKNELHDVDGSRTTGKTSINQK